MDEVRRPDDEIARSIRVLLGAGGLPGAASVAVQVVNGRVHIGGVVASQAERERAIELARGVAGVVAVIDEFVALPTVG